MMQVLYKRLHSDNELSSCKVASTPCIVHMAHYNCRYRMFYCTQLQVRRFSKTVPQSTAAAGLSTLKTAPQDYCTCSYEIRSNFLYSECPIGSQITPPHSGRSSFVATRSIYFPVTLADIWFLHLFACRQSSLCTLTIANFDDCVIEPCQALIRSKRDTINLAQI